MRAGVMVLGLALVCGLAHGAEVKMEKVAYGGWDNCIRLSNGSLELVVTTDVGPRVIRMGFVNGQNMFFENKTELGTTGGTEWKSYGGHRLWHAPEVAPRTYWPDNVPVDYDWDGKTLTLVQPMEESNRISKEIEVTLDAGTDHVQVLHRLINRNPWQIELVPWCLTVMAQRSRAIFPQEEFRPHPDYFLPARPLVLWHYTDMTDPRWTWGTKYVQLQQDPNRNIKQKVGVMNTKGWAASYLNGDLFVKRFPFDPKATYVDFGCNNEFYTDGSIVEVESLGPLSPLVADGGAVEYTEHWFLFKTEVGTDEESIDAKVLPLVGKTDAFVK